jgi:hypothetical protein
MSLIQYNKPIGRTFNPGQPFAAREKVGITPPTIFALHFAGNTFVSFATGPFIAATAVKVEYTARMEDYTSNRDPWGTNTGQNYGRWRNNPDFRMFRNGTGTNFALNHVQNTIYTVTEDVTAAGAATITVTGLGTDTGTLGAAINDNGPWKIGTRDAGIPFIGAIKDFKVYHDDVLVHHWPLVDGVADGGQIEDVVGTLHGTLTMGSGSWVNS